MKILALNGGGMLGYYTICLLEKIEEDSGHKCADLYDLITGVSTGSIIGSALALGIPATEVKTMYRNMRERIFGKKRGFLHSLFCPYYDIENVEAVVKEVIGTKTLKDVDVDLMIYATKISGLSIDTTFWKSWGSRRDDFGALYQMICASSAAPQFFRPYRIEGSWYTDGGVSAVNPSVCGLAEAIRRGEKLEDIRVMNIWCEHDFAYARPEKSLRGLLNVAQNIGTLCISAGSDVATYQSQQLLGDRFLKLSPTASLSISTDKFDVMQGWADKTWDTRRTAILSWLELLT